MATEATYALILFGVVLLGPLGLMLWILSRKPHKKGHWIALLLMVPVQLIAMYFALKIGFTSSDPNIRFIGAMSGLIGVVGAVSFVMAIHVRDSVRWDKEAEAQKNPKK